MIRRSGDGAFSPLSLGASYVSPGPHSTIGPAACHGHPAFAYPADGYGSPDPYYTQHPASLYPLAMMHPFMHGQGAGYVECVRAVL